MIELAETVEDIDSNHILSSAEILSPGFKGCLVLCNTTVPFKKVT